MLQKVILHYDALLSSRSGEATSNSLRKHQNVQTVPTNFRGDSCLRSSYCSVRWITETAVNPPPREQIRILSKSFQERFRILHFWLFILHRSQAKLCPQSNATIRVDSWCKQQKKELNCSKTVSKSWKFSCWNKTDIALIHAEIAKQDSWISP